MAQKATIFKADLSIADMDRHYYADHALTLALHPSETHARLMLRLVAFALHATENLSFTRGLSAEDEPDIWRKSLTDEIELWIELGLPDERRLRKAAGRAKQVWVYAYGNRGVDVWWEKSAKDFNRIDNLRIFALDDATISALESLIERSMQLSFTMQDGDIWLSNGITQVPISWRVLK
ncbi:MAG: YaeQ family protein [Halothiobacillaceae bacterium]|nr:YaeQ family protein [Halothiobacillaceae bacterium]